MRQSSHSCVGLVFTLFDPPFTCSSPCCKDQFAVLYFIETVKLAINVVMLKMHRLCLHFSMHVLVILFFSVLLVSASLVRSGSNTLKVCSSDTCFTQSCVVLFHGQ